jgi:hypothetical protein
MAGGLKSPKRGLFERIARRQSHKPARLQASTDGEASGGMTDVAGRGIGKIVDAASSNPGTVPGPSPNPATNLIIQDIAMRAGGRLIRVGVEKGLLRGRYGGTGAKAIVENRSMMHTLLSGLLARYATRSLPGAAIIGTGLAAKTLYDRRRTKKSAKKAGDKSLAKMARK